MSNMECNIQGDGLQWLVPFFHYALHMTYKPVIIIHI